jgi:hypothetical protein
MSNGQEDSKEFRRYPKEKELPPALDRYIDKSKGEYRDRYGNIRHSLKEGWKFERQTGKWRVDSPSGLVYPHDIADLSFDQYTKDRPTIGRGMQYTFEGETPQKRQADMVSWKIRNLIEGKKQGHKSYHPDTGRPGLSARDQALGADLIKNVTNQLGPDKVDEFYDKLKAMESTHDVYSENRDEYKPYFAAKKGMGSFLDKNVIAPEKPLQIRRTAEDKIMNGFLQQDNKYKMGE